MSGAARAALALIIALAVPTGAFALTSTVAPAPVPTPIVPALLHDASYVGVDASLPRSLRWLVVASRPSYDSAVRYAREFSGTVAPCVVVQSQNGWYAVLAGVLDMPKGEANLGNLKGVRLIPQDSYLSSGNNFHTIVWSGYAGTNIDVMDQRAVRSTVRRMQHALREAGFYSDAIDGLLGKRTVRAYQAYERASGTGGGWGESYMGAAGIARLEGFAGERRTMLARRAAEREERERLARIEREREATRALERQLASGEWRSLDEMRTAQARGFTDGTTYRAARREGLGSATLHAEFEASDFRDGATFLAARQKGFGTLRDYETARAGEWRDADEMTAGLGEGYATGTDYRAARRGGFEGAEQYADAMRRGFSTRLAMERAEAGDHATASQMAAAKAGGFDTGGAYRDARERGFETRAERDAAGRAGYRTAEPWERAVAAGFATRAEAEEASARGFATAAARDGAEALGFTTAAAHDDARRHGWRDAAEREAGVALGFAQGSVYRAARAGGFADAKAYRAAAARGLATRRDVAEADRLGYRTGPDMARGIEGGFADGEEYRAAAAMGFTTRADWRRGVAGGFEAANDLTDADRGGYRDMAELRAGRDGGFDDATALRAALDAGFVNAAQVARATELGYRSAASMAAGTDGGFVNANAYRAARARGFASRSEMARAEAAGFPTATERDAAAARGFPTMAALKTAKAAGFDRADDYSAYRASGFATREAFLRARERGHVTRAAALEDAVGRLDLARAAATDALSDAELFIRRTPRMPDLMEVVGVVGEVTRALGVETDREDLDAVRADLATLDRRRGRLLQSLGRDANFAPFHAQRVAEREAAHAERLAAARAELEGLRESTTAWVAANLLHPGVQEMVGLMDEVEIALATGEASAMEGASERVRIVALAHGATVDRAGRALASREGGGDGEGGDAPFAPDMMLGAADAEPGDLPPGIDPVRTGSVASRAGAAGRAAAIAVTDANRFLVEGPADGIVGLYNVGRDEPNVVIDILGDVVFLESRASACTIGVGTSGAEGRHLRAVLREAGIERMGAVPECSAAGVKDADLVLARRGRFRTGAETALVDRVLSDLERGSLRRFDPVSTRALAYAEAAETVLLGAIAADLANGGRAGFGAVSLRESGPFCMVGDKGIDAHAALLAAESSAAERIQADPVPTTLRDAYVAVQRGGCATVYASGADLATLVTALDRDGHEHALLPFWIEEGAVEAEIAARDRAALDTERAAAERAREREALAAIAAEAKRAMNETLAVRTAALRVQNGTLARGLADRFDAMLDDMVAGCAGCTARKGDLVAEQFPALAEWHAARTRGDDWEVDDLAVEIADYGDVDHEGRAIRGVAVRVDFDLSSPGRGTKRRECFALGAAWDDEFGRWRDPFTGACDDGSAEVWARGYAMRSLWTASADTAGEASSEAAAR